MADFLLDDVGANPDLPFYRPRDFASRLGLRKTEFFRTTHPEEPPHVSNPAEAKPFNVSEPAPHPDPPHPEPREPLNGERPPEVEGRTVNDDGSITVTNREGKQVTKPFGERGNSTTSKPEETLAKEPADRKAANEKDRQNIMDKISKGLMLIPLLLPLALLLASVIQGEADCENVNSQTMDVTNVVSAAWPQGLPSWVPQSGTTKYDIAYSPCTKILANDLLTFTDSSNTFPTGQFPIDSVPQPCYVRIDFGKTLTIDSNVANVATFTDKTSCADRMAYAAGQDAGIVANAAGEGLSGAVSGLFGNINFGTIGMILLAIVAVYFAIQFARQVI